MTQLMTQTRDETPFIAGQDTVELIMDRAHRGADDVCVSINGSWRLELCCVCASGGRYIYMRIGSEVDVDVNPLPNIISISLSS